MAATTTPYQRLAILGVLLAIPQDITAVRFS